MELTKMMVLMVITGVLFKFCVNSPLSVTENSDHILQNAQRTPSLPEYEGESSTLSSSGMCPVTTEAPLPSPPPPPEPKRAEQIWWYRVVENVTSFILTFTYCHCNFIIGFERYTWFQLISNSLMSVVIHPFIYSLSWLLDILIE